MSLNIESSTENSILDALFNLHPINACQIRGQKENMVRKLLLLQNKAMGIF